MPASGIGGYPTFPAPAASVSFLLIQDVKSSGVDGGTFTTGADQTRVLNTVVSDTDSLLSSALVSNQFSLIPGEYIFHITAPAYAVQKHQAWLYNVTDAVVQQRGSSEWSGSGTSATSTRSFVNGYVRLQAVKTFEVRHRCSQTSTTNGFGISNGSGFGSEIYTTVEFWKIG